MAYLGQAVVPWYLHCHKISNCGQCAQCLQREQPKQTIAHALHTGLVRITLAGGRQLIPYVPQLASCGWKGQVLRIHGNCALSPPPPTHLFPSDIFANVSANKRFTDSASPQSKNATSLRSCLSVGKTLLNIYCEPTTNRYEQSHCRMCRFLTKVALQDVICIATCIGWENDNRIQILNHYSTSQESIVWRSLVIDAIYYSQLKATLK